MQEAILVVSEGRMDLHPPLPPPASVVPRAQPGATAAPAPSVQEVSPQPAGNPAPVSNVIPPIELWLPYFIVVERYVAKFNAFLGEGANMVASELISFVPGGSFVQKPLEFFAWMAIDNFLKNGKRPEDEDGP